MNKRFLHTTFLLAAFVLVFFFSSQAVQAQEQPFDPSCEYEAMLENNGLTILLIDPDSNQIVYANRAAQAFYGYTKDQLLGLTVSQINVMGPEKIQAEIEQAQRNHKNHFLFQHRLADGTRHYVEVYSVPAQYQGKPVLFSMVYDVDNKIRAEKANRSFRITASVLGILATFFLLYLLGRLTRKRTILKKANAALQQFNTLRETFINADPDYVYLKDDQLRYLFANEAMGTLFGCSVDDLIGKDDYDFLPADFATMCTQADLDALNQMTRVNSITSWKGRYYRTTKFPVQLPSGRYGVGAYVRDSTEEYLTQKQQERELLWHQLLLSMLENPFASKKEQLDFVLKETLDLTQSQWGTITLFDYKTKAPLETVQLLLADAQEPEKEAYKRLHAALQTSVLEHGKPVCNTQPEKDRSLCSPSHYLYVPTFLDGKIVAVTGIAGKDAVYTDLDSRLLTMLMGSVWNVIQRREFGSTLAYEQSKSFRTLMSIGDGVIVVNTHQKIELINPVAERLTGWSSEEAVGTDYREVFVLQHELAHRTIRDPIAQVFKTGQVYELENHALLISKNGAITHLEDSAAPIHDEQGTLAGVVLVFRDVTERKAQRKKIEYLSYHDTLTGLYNRTYFEERLKDVDAEALLPLTLLMCDVNNLKLTNDVFGHTIGDRLLAKIATTLQAVCRSEDTVARKGGDEFVLLLPRTSQDQVQSLIDRIRSEVGKLRIHSITGSLSIGSATKTQASQDIQEVLNLAETRMYQCKTLNRRGNQHKTLKAITHKLYSIDARIQKHLAAVGHLAQGFGEALQLPEDQLEILVRAARLHDIGKVILDQRFSRYGEQQSAHDGRPLEQHPTTGYRILNYFDQTVALADVVLAHHERWDGGGYPKGSRQKAIPFLARILAILNAFDHAMATRLPLHQALESLTREAGLAYDPDLMRQFVHWVTKETDRSVPKRENT